VSVQGLDQLLQNVDAAERQMAANIFRAMEKAMKVLWTEYQQQMKAMIYDTPESPNYQRTYQLYTEAFWAVAPSIAQGIIEGAVWNDKEYAVFVELGTRYMPARPCLQAAVEATWNEIADILGKVMNISIQYPTRDLGKPKSC
jgi:HK97 gp10 family phage protein